MSAIDVDSKAHHPGIFIAGSEKGAGGTMLGLRWSPRWLFLPVVFFGTLLTSSAILWLNLPNVSFSQVMDQLVVEGDFAELKNALASNAAAVEWAFMVQGIFVILLFSLLVGVSSATSFTGDNEKHLRTLLQTPNKIRPVIRGKLKQRMRGNFLFLLAYALPAFSLAWIASTVCFAGTVLWWIAAWPIMTFIGAVGIWCSVRTRHSIPSLLATFSFGYLGGMVVFLLIVPVIMVVAIVIFMLLQLLGPHAGSAPTVFISRDPLFYTAFMLASALVSMFFYFGLSRHFLTRAERRILVLAQGRR